MFEDMTIFSTFWKETTFTSVIDSEIWDFRNEERFEKLTTSVSDYAPTFNKEITRKITFSARISGTYSISVLLRKVE